MLALAPWSGHHLVWPWFMKPVGDEVIKRNRCKRLFMFILTDGEKIDLIKQDLITFSVFTNGDLGLTYYCNNNHFIISPAFYYLYLIDFPSCSGRLLKKLLLKPSIKSEKSQMCTISDRHTDIGKNLSLYLEIFVILHKLWLLSSFKTLSFIFF